ncbi:MAG: RsmF rRNA methyltransferase first C-terminal domain-containing protein [Lachnospiraceae bacterium]|nr:RsmF rRNA methyltransferase first C-terminal domain-containing protein [Lachnospiraceae bacterium]
MKLPEAFCARMKKMLGDEYPAFLHSYEAERKQALRLNPLRQVPEDFPDGYFRTLRPVPWSADAYFYDGCDRPGRHPLHEAGLYYIQEPSAMLPALLLNAAKGERILDLCAAPGGKSTQIAGMLRGEGLLVSNEIHPARVRILSENIERMGIGNAVVTNADASHLASHFPAYFDAVLVDAPCSGEGMFRKEPEAVLQWSEENVRRCAVRQREILHSAAGMVRAGGRLVYSTCTFSEEENEETIAAFLSEHPDYEQVSIPELLGDCMESWGFTAGSDKKSLRIYPHRAEGEGHFAALLVRCKGAGSADGKVFRAGSAGKKTGGKQGAALREAIRLWEEFSDSFLTHRGKESLEKWDEFVLFGDTLHLLPAAVPMTGLKVMRAGLCLGRVAKGRFIPDHALARFLNRDGAVNVFELGENAEKYLRGETVALPDQGSSPHGWSLMTISGCPAGWGKAAGSVIKNHYPKGLRPPG